MADALPITITIPGFRPSIGSAMVTGSLLTIEERIAPWFHLDEHAPMVISATKPVGVMVNPIFSPSSITAAAVNG